MEQILADDGAKAKEDTKCRPKQEDVLYRGLTFVLSGWELSDDAG
jgi:hypothetical protein